MRGGGRGSPQLPLSLSPLRTTPWDIQAVRPTAVRPIADTFLSPPAWRPVPSAGRAKNLGADTFLLFALRVLL